MSNKQMKRELEKLEEKNRRRKKNFNLDRDELKQEVRESQARVKSRLDKWSN
ncbi:hypothetical protein [Enterococcus sp. LJL90]